MRKLRGKTISVLIFIFLFSTFTAGATTIPPDAKNIVTFIFVKDANGQLVPFGTGFFVGVQNEKMNYSSNVYLVTSKHVLKDAEGNFHPSIFIRLNTRSGGAEFIEIPTTFNGQNMVFTHGDPSVDIACIPCLPDKVRFDYKYLPESYLTTRELFTQNHIQEGDDVFFTGLFLGHFGKNKNYPIVRFGKVAMIPDEQVEWDGTLMDLYLMEAQSFEGNSGSPVFFYLEKTRNSGVFNSGNKVLLAGIVQGNFSKGSMVTMNETGDVSFTIDNIGISAVVPAYKLHEVLYSKDLIDQRKSTVNGLRASR